MPAHPPPARQGTYSTASGLKEHIVHALELAKSDLEAKHQKANFVRIIMRFPQIRSVFDRLKAIHAKCDDNGMEKLVRRSEVDEAEETKGEGLDVKQFIVMCAIGFILAEENKELSTFGGMLASGDDAYRRAMTDVVTAYLSFDREGKGHFTRMNSKGSCRRLDVSGDGKVDFEEFVYAFSKWVSDEDEEEDDEDPYLSRKANPLTPRVLLALQLSKTKLEKNEKGVNFTRIIMRFPKIHKVFDRLRSIHAKYDTDNSGNIELSELYDAMNEIMTADDETTVMDKSQIESIFMLSDLDHHGAQEGLDVKEFIVFLITGEVSENDKEYRDAMMDIVGAYLTFDKEGKGYFTSDEMHNAVQSVGKKDAGNLLTPERWRELDIDHSGVVDFEEFVHAFSLWIRPEWTLAPISCGSDIIIYSPRYDEADYGQDYADDNLYQNYAMQHEEQAAVGKGGGFGLGQKLTKKHKQDQKTLYTQYYNDVYKLEEQKAEQQLIIDQLNNKLLDTSEQHEMENLQREYDEFKQPDIDGDDRISRTEFHMYVKNYLSNYPGLTEKDYPKFEEFDHDKDGYVSFQEYAQQMAVQAQEAELDQYYAQSQGASGKKEAQKANALYDLYGSAADSGGFNDLYAQIRN
ncbi:EF-hand domain-containing protein [Skeletonema marinoi]|uniref:EF-hand domain-containing protein n=1 Tax=Skeletonema marinoi TaxID=267567 RepID=A0AAD8YJV0_9STRA|nr:EF-hand domain-containing protein [Skeletonema marinoi]